MSIFTIDCARTAMLFALPLSIGLYAGITIGREGWTWQDAFGLFVLLPIAYLLGWWMA